MTATADWALGVDFGEVHTAAALRDPLGQVSELPLSSTGMVMASAVFCMDQQILVGAPAIQAGIDDPPALELHPKRLLATNPMDWALGPVKPKVYVPGLVAAVLSEALSRAREVTGGQIPQELVLTYPDSQSESSSERSARRNGLQQAADLLVCRRSKLVPDSMAITRFIETDVQLAAPAIVVIDFGAAECDAVACVRQYDGSYAPVASRSVTRLGGLALEARVRDWVCRSLQTRLPSVRAALGEPLSGNALRLRLAVRQAITTLSGATSADINIDIAPEPAVLRLTRAEFDALARGYLDAAVELTREMLTVAKQLKESSAGTVIVATGAAARNPTLRHRLGELAFLADLGDPRTIIARGAAYCGTFSSGARADTSFRPPAARSRHGQVDGEPRQRSADGKATTPSLLAEVTRDGRACPRALAPGCEHELHVRIEHGQPAVGLVVDVSSADGTIQRSAPLSPGCDGSKPGTAASVSFTTGGDGSSVRLNIRVLRDGRPVHAAQLAAPVRTKPSLRDHVRLLHVPLSATVEPRADTTKAEATLECTATALKRLGTDAPTQVPLSVVTAISAVMQESASKVLSGNDAPDRLDEPAAVTLLINLARLGRRLADTLADIGVTDAHTIAVKSRRDLPIVPLELAYDGVAPEPGAALCGCLSRPNPQRGAVISHASAQTVCPYAFWGMSRAIIRTVAAEPVKRLPARPRLAPLSLRPVLYGAADSADELSPPWQPLTETLEKTLSGRAVGQCTRVSSWRAWRRAARGVAPQLLVVLADTEMRKGTPKLLIGSKSRLAPGSVSLGRRAVTAPAPLVLLFGTGSDVVGAEVGIFPAAFIDQGAAAVITTLISVGGAQAAAAAAAVVHAMHSNRLPTPTVAAAVSAARRQLIACASPVGLLLATYGETDLELIASRADATFGRGLSALD